MTNILDYVNDLTPFVQSLVASGVFAVAVILLRFLIKIFHRGGKSAFRVISLHSVLKHIIHRDYVTSDNHLKFTWGNLFIIRQAFQSTIQAIAVLVFVGGVSAILSDEWLKVAGYFIAFNLLFDANSWLKDWSSEKEITAFDEDIKSKLLSRFPSSKTKESSDTTQS